MSNALEVYRELLQCYGPQGWWPGESPFEVMVGAVLVQNTAWENVERAIDNLRDAGVVDPQLLSRLASSDLEELVYPAGYYRIKARRLHNLVELIVADYNGSIDAMRRVDPDEMRRQLLAVNGVGPETADSILLYALEAPAVVVDAYTLRVWARHGWIGFDADYHSLQSHIADELPQDVKLLNEFHALMVRVGRTHCRRTARCDGCPLAGILPPGGVVAPSD